MGHRLAWRKRGSSSSRWMSTPPTSPIPITRLAASSRLSKILSQPDNTLIFYISGDNGPSAEGLLHGTQNEFTAFNGVSVPSQCQFLWYHSSGDPTGRSRHFAAPWAWAMATRSSGSSKWRRILVGRLEAWRCRGRVTSRCGRHRACRRTLRQESSTQPTRSPRMSRSQRWRGRHDRHAWRRFGGYGLFLSQSYNYWFQSLWFRAADSALCSSSSF